MNMRYFLLVSMALSLSLVGCKKDDDEAPAPTVPVITGTPCTYTVGAWGPWEDGYRERTVVASPTGCTGTPPASIEEHPCVDGNDGWLRVVNNSSNPYRVTITGPTSLPPFDLAGGFMLDSIYVGAGSYGLYALQLSGYIFTPSEFNGTRTVVQCNQASWSFP